MDLQYLFNEVPLYVKEEFKVFEIKEEQYIINEEEFDRFKAYVGFNTTKIVTYCHKCKKEFPFKVVVKYIDFMTDIHTNIHVMIFTNDSLGDIEGRIDTKTGKIYGTQPPYPIETLLHSKIWYVEYSFECTNDSNHKYLMVITIELKNGNFIVRKIGQNPSILTIKGFDFDKYKTILDKIKAYEDYKKADLSYADQFYVGAYAYLRRIFEKEVNKYLKNENDKKLHMDKKIDKIKDKFDPRIKDVLKNLYSILSISIHELDEKQSKEYYQYLKAIIDIQLEYEYTELEKEKQSNNLKSVLNKITNGIKMNKD